MKTLILSQSGGICPTALLETIALNAIPFLHGNREPIRFKYPDCEGIVTTKGVYTSLNSFFGLIISAEVEHQELRHRIDVKMMLTPRLKKSDLLVGTDPESEFLPPVWASLESDESEEVSIADAETRAMN